MMTLSSVPWLAWLIDATIKGSILILLGALVLRLIGRHTDARWRHALWLLIVLRLALPTAPSSSFSIFNLLPDQQLPRVQWRNLTQSVASVQVEGGAESPRMRTRSPVAWSQEAKWFAGVWLFGALLIALRMLIASIRVDRAVARGRGGAEDRKALEKALEEASRQLGMRRRVRIVECDAIRTPALHGLMRPSLLIPPGFARSFDREELRHVMLHELSHLRRFDVAVSWGLAALQCLHWFNPFVWFAVLRIKEERELACDELALSCLEEEERYGYGRTILKLLDHFRTPAPVPALVGIVEQKETMKRRLMMIASFRNRKRISVLFAAALAGVVLVGFTDAVAGERRVMRHMDPAAHATIEKLHQRISLNATNASFADFLSTVSSSSGVTVTQAPEVATSEAQRARFTVAADNVPAHAVLMESLAPFGLMAKPDANGVTITKGDCEMMSGGDGESEKIRRKIVVKEHDDMIARSAAAGVDGGVKGGVSGGVAGGVKGGVEGGVPGEVRIRTRSTSATSVGEGEEIEKQVVIRARGTGDKVTCEFKEGTIHRELALDIEENGVKSEGKLTIDITAGNQ